jgi:hypothetical protein
MGTHGIRKKGREKTRETQEGKREKQTERDYK